LGRSSLIVWNADDSSETLDTKSEQFFLRAKHRFITAQLQFALKGMLIGIRSSGTLADLKATSSRLSPFNLKLRNCASLILTQLLLSESEAAFSKGIALQALQTVKM